jgi:hypothetical protein
MSVGARGGQAAVDIVQAHQRMLADRSLQFVFRPAPPPPPPKPPDWLAPLLKGLESAAPAVQWVFWAGLAAGLGVILFFIGREVLRVRWPHRFKRPARTETPAESWRPTHAQALALLEEVDRLAAAGLYAEAAHLLLHRSIQDIQGRRPNVVRPALTSRDISVLPALPASAREAFVGIARVVERSRFGGAPVGREDFSACRRAYEDFAFPEVWA